MSDRPGVTSLAGQLARELLDAPRPELAQQVVELAVREIDGCDASALSVVQRRHDITTPASTHPSAAHGDELQYETGQGPCLDAIHQQRVVRAPDLAAEERWPVWASRMAAESGYRSMMCLRLYTERGLLMERFQLDEAGSFALLARLSSHTNRKLRDVAAELVRTRRLPADPAAEEQEPSAGDA